MKTTNSSRYILFLFILVKGSVALAQTGPVAGDIYREYSVNLKTGNNWRVTDPNVTWPDAAPFLPNPVLSIQIDDLEGAVRAEALMDIWGGHPGTSNKRFRFNNREWMRIPEIPTIDVDPECVMSQYNVIMDIPLEYLKQGYNTFEGTSGGQICASFNWGQWGWYVMIVRIYYGSEKPHTSGSIEYPASGSVIKDNPEISVSVEKEEDVSEIQILGKYRGYDERGQGYYEDWHRAYHGVNIEGHIGTVANRPFKQVWDTEWVPDQEPGKIEFLARIKNKKGMWYVTKLVNNISLDRKGSHSLKMFTPTEVPRPFWVRSNDGGTPKTQTCLVAIPDLQGAAEARLFHRTWNAADDADARGTVSHPLLVNGYGFKTFGKNHNFALSNVSIPVENLKEGQNFVSYSSNTTHHGIEILWPGPAIMVRYEGVSSNIQIENNQDSGSFTSFPNPFSGNTTFQFDLHRPERVSLALYTLNGELVSTLLKTKLNAGRHELDFDGKDLSPGMYFARLDTGQKNEMLKILIK